MKSAPIRWGIIGPGRIASKVAADFAYVDGAELVAVASRSPERAKAFAAAHQIPRAYGTYADLYVDPGVDVLYVATPHPQHHAVAMAALKSGKALLVEKAFTATFAGASEVIASARASGRFVMEAMWTRFQPAIVKARSLIADGAIGEVRAVQADLGIAPPYDPTQRFFDPGQGGGAMLDLGAYLVSFAQMILGTPVEMAVQGSRAPSGVDAEVSMLLGFSGNRRAALLMSLMTALPGQARILGTAGFIDVPPRFHHPREIVLHRAGAEPERFHLPPLGGGYAHELIEVTECIRAGKTESSVMPLSDTLAVQKVMNEACEHLGVFHAEGT